MAEKENYIRKLIAEEGLSLRDFASKIKMPYSTLTTILNGSIDKAALENAFKICKGLDITIAQLDNLNFKDDKIERELLKTFRELNEHYKKIALEQMKILRDNQK